VSTSVIPIPPLSGLLIKVDLFIFPPFPSQRKLKISLLMTSMVLFGTRKEWKKVGEFWN